MPQLDDQISVGQQPAPRGKRPANARVLPAIPLSFGKQKVARPPPTSLAEPTTKAGLEHAPDHDTTTGARAAATSPVKLARDGVAADGLPTDKAETPMSQSSEPVSRPDLPADTRASPASLPRHEVVSPSIDTARPEPALRKPVERFDMRHIRTELPPAFVPFAEQHTPQSATSSQARSFMPGRPPAHPHHPSMSSIVFGSHDSAASSPIPPPGQASAFAPPSGPPQMTHHSHAHHSSRPGPQPLANPASSQNAAVWAVRPSFTPDATMSYHPQAFGPQPYPSRESFGVGASSQQNGFHSRSEVESRSSSTVPDGQQGNGGLQSPLYESTAFNATTLSTEPRGVYNPYPPTRQPQMLPSGPLPMFPPDFMGGLANAESLRDHMLTHLTNPDFADCHVRVLDEYGEGHELPNCHRVILARSVKLLGLLRQASPVPGSGKILVEVRLSGQFLRTRPFVDAIRYLYGGPPPTLHIYNFASSLEEQVPSNEQRMDVVLQQIAMASWLKVIGLGHRGVDAASGLLHWDTVTIALAFALDGGLGQLWTVDDGSEERTSTCSSDDSLGKPEAGGVPTYDPHASELLHRILDFTVHTLPPNFYLDASAPQLASRPRLPSPQLAHGSRPSRSDPRLSNIRFGEVPVDDHQRPSFATTTISSILLSLPFPILRFLLEHPDMARRLGAETVGSIMRQVVNEREVRRRKALQARPVSHVDVGLDAHVVQNLYWEEFVEPSRQHTAGCRLLRRRGGIDTPPSSGNESERTKA